MLLIYSTIGIIRLWAFLQNNIADEVSPILTDHMMGYTVSHVVTEGR